MSNVNQQITAAILDQLDKGVIPWTKPWVVNSTGIVSHDKGRPYGLRNRMLLRFAGEYATFNQIKKAGGSVKKGEHGQVVYFAKNVAKKDDSGEVTDVYYLLRGYTVFRVGSQTEGVETLYNHLWEYGGVPLSNDAILSVVKEYTDRVGIKLIGGGAEAFYSPSRDTVQCPGVDSFPHRELFYKTLFHELVHSTGRDDRCKRPTGDTFGSSDYAVEELVADIGACLCMGRLGLQVNMAIPATAAYIASWKKHISNFKQTDFSTCIWRAEEAVRFIFNDKEHKDEQ